MTSRRATTRLVTLTADHEAMRAAWHADARRLSGRATREGVQVTIRRDPDPASVAAFHGLLRETATRGAFRARSEGFLERVAAGFAGPGPAAPTGGWYLALAELEGRPDRRHGRAPRGRSRLLPLRRLAPRPRPAARVRGLRGDGRAAGAPGRRRRAHVRPVGRGRGRRAPGPTRRGPASAPSSARSAASRCAIPARSTWSLTRSGTASGSGATWRVPSGAPEASARGAGVAGYTARHGRRSCLPARGQARARPRPGPRARPPAGRRAPWRRPRATSSRPSTSTIRRPTWSPSNGRTASRRRRTRARNGPPASPMSPIRWPPRRSWPSSASTPWR